MSENDDAILMYLWVPTILILLLAIGCYTYGGRAFATLVIVLALTAMSVILAIAWNKSIRHRILAITACFFCIMLVYGSIYHIIFLTDPSSFAFSTSIEEGKVFGGFEGAFASLQEENEKLYVLSLLDKEAGLGFSIVSENLEHRFDDDHAIKAYEWIDIMSESGTKYKGLEITHGSKSVKLEGTVDAIYNIYPEERALARLFSAADVQGFHGRLKELISVIESKRVETITRLQSNLKGQPEWEFLDFCYFSAITMTTVGYGDMLPNNRKARLVVMLQAISGVMFVGFSLTFLWPGAR